LPKVELVKSAPKRVVEIVKEEPKRFCEVVSQPVVDKSIADRVRHELDMDKGLV
jgi:hypothetical protein